jgi:hypothetical protein
MTIADNSNLNLNNPPGEVWGFTHISSDGHTQKIADVHTQAAALLLDLGKRVQQVVTNGTAVTQFKIHLQDRVCRYVDKNGQRIAVNLSNYQDDTVKEFLDRAAPFTSRRHKLDKSGQPIDGRQKLSVSKSLLKAESPYVYNKASGFAKERQLFAHYAMSASNGRDRGELIRRYGYSALMHQQLHDGLRAALARKDKKGDKRREEVLKALRAEVENVDVFATSLALNYFPTVGQLIENYGVLQMEATLHDEIEKSKKQLENHLTSKNNFNLAQDKKEAAYSDQYIKENCVGLLNLTYSAQRAHAKKHKLTTPAASLESVFVNGAIAQDTSEFKSYYEARLPKEEIDLCQEIQDIVDASAQAFTKAMSAVQTPSCDEIRRVRNPNPATPSQDYLDARAAMTDKLAQYSADLTKALQ